MDTRYPSQPVWRRDPHRTRSTPALLRTIGEALYGPRWQTELGIELGVSNRSVRRWLTGECEPKPEVWEDIDQILASREAEQRRVREFVRKERGLTERLIADLPTRLTA